MKNQFTFSFIKGTSKESCTINFETEKVSLFREGFLYITNGLINMEFGFDQITGIECSPGNLFKNEQYQFILDNRRLCSSENAKTTVTVFNVSRENKTAVAEVIRKLAERCNINSISKFGKIDAIPEIYQYQYSIHLINDRGM